MRAQDLFLTTEQLIVLLAAVGSSWAGMNGSRWGLDLQSTKQQSRVESFVALYERITDRWNLTNALRALEYDEHVRNTTFPARPKKKMHYR